MKRPVCGGCESRNVWTNQDGTVHCRRCGGTTLPDGRVIEPGGGRRRETKPERIARIEAELAALRGGADV